MDKIINLPLTHSMSLLECDECKETALNLYMSDDFKTLAYRCITCNYVGYFHGEKGEDDESNR